MKLIINNTDFSSISTAVYYPSSLGTSEIPFLPIWLYTENPNTLIGYTEGDSVNSPNDLGSPYSLNALDGLPEIEISWMDIYWRGLQIGYSNTTSGESTIYLKSENIFPEYYTYLGIIPLSVLDGMSMDYIQHINDITPIYRRSLVLPVQDAPRDGVLPWNSESSYTEGDFVYNDHIVWVRTSDSYGDLPENKYYIFTSGEWVEYPDFPRENYTDVVYGLNNDVFPDTDLSTLQWPHPPQEGDIVKISPYDWREYIVENCIYVLRRTHTEYLIQKIEFSGKYYFYWLPSGSTQIDIEIILRRGFYREFNDTDNNLTSIYYTLSDEGIDPSGIIHFDSTIVYATFKYQNKYIGIDTDINGVPRYYAYLHPVYFSSSYLNYTSEDGVGYFNRWGTESYHVTNTPRYHGSSENLVNIPNSTVLENFAEYNFNFLVEKYPFNRDLEIQRLDPSSFNRISGVSDLSWLEDENSPCYNVETLSALEKLLFPTLTEEMSSNMYFKQYRNQFFGSTQIGDRTLFLFDVPEDIRKVELFSETVIPSTFNSLMDYDWRVLLPEGEDDNEKYKPCISIYLGPEFNWTNTTQGPEPDTPNFYISGDTHSEFPDFNESVPSKTYVRSLDEISCRKVIWIILTENNTGEKFNLSYGVVSKDKINPFRNKHEYTLRNDEYWSTKDNMGIIKEKNKILLDDRSETILTTEKVDTHPILTKKLRKFGLSYFQADHSYQPGEKVKYEGKTWKAAELIPAYSQDIDFTDFIDYGEEFSDFSQITPDNTVFYYDEAIYQYRQVLDQVTVEVGDEQRTAHIKSGPAEILAIGGNSVAWNQLVNQSDSSSTAYGVTKTISNNVITLSGTYDSTFPSQGYYAGGNIPNNVIIGHVYYLALNIITWTVMDGDLKILIRGLPAAAAVNNTTPASISTANDSFSNIRFYSAAGTQVNVQFRLQLHDLTAIFGAGNEPTTVADFEAWREQSGLPSVADYNAGELLSVKMSGMQTNTSKLPLGYQELEYIESTGTQYIDTGITNENCNTYGIKTKYNYTGITSSISLCGNFENHTGKASFGQIFTSASHTGDGIYIGIGNIRTCSVTDITVGVDYVDEFTADCSVGTIIRTLNGNTYTDSNIDFSLRGSRNCLLFCCNSSGGATQKVRAKIYYFQILKDGNIVLNFIPCKNSSNVIGMYDTVSGQFFTNLGTGTFIGGPEVHLDTLPFDVTTFTGLNPNTNTREVMFADGMCLGNDGYQDILIIKDDIQGIYNEAEKSCEYKLLPSLDGWVKGIPEVNHWYFQVAVDNLCNYDPSDLSSILCNNYETRIATISSGYDTGISTYTQAGVSYIRVYDERYSTVDAFLAANSTTAVIYSLEEPIIYTEVENEFGQPLSSSNRYNIQIGGTEMVLPQNTSTPTTVAPILITEYETDCEIQYKYNVRGEYYAYINGTWYSESDPEDLYTPETNSQYWEEVYEIYSPYRVYRLGERVLFNSQVWESLCEDNLGNRPDISRQWIISTSTTNFQTSRISILINPGNAGSVIPGGNSVTIGPEINNIPFSTVPSLGWRLDLSNPCSSDYNIPLDSGYYHIYNDNVVDVSGSAWSTLMQSRKLIFNFVSSDALITIQAIIGNSFSPEEYNNSGWQRQGSDEILKLEYSYPYNEEDSSSNIFTMFNLGDNGITPTLDDSQNMLAFRLIDVSNQSTNLPIQNKIDKVSCVATDQFGNSIVRNSLPLSDGIALDHVNYKKATYTFYIGKVAVRINCVIGLEVFELEDNMIEYSVGDTGYFRFYPRIEDGNIPTVFMYDNVEDAAEMSDDYANIQMPVNVGDSTSIPGVSGYFSSCTATKLTQHYSFGDRTYYELEFTDIQKEIVIDII